MLNEKVVKRFVEKHPTIALEIESGRQGEKWFTFTIREWKGKEIIIRVRDMGEKAQWWIYEFPLNTPLRIKLIGFALKSFPLSLNGWQELKRFLLRFCDR